MEGVTRIGARRGDDHAENAEYLAFADAVIRAMLVAGCSHGGHVGEERILRELGRSAGDRASRALLDRMRRDELIDSDVLADPFDRGWRLRSRGRRLAGALSAALDERLHAAG